MHSNHLRQTVENGGSQFPSLFHYPLCKLFSDPKAGPKSIVHPRSPEGKPWTGSGEERVDFSLPGKYSPRSELGRFRTDLRNSGKTGVEPDRAVAQLVRDLVHDGNKSLTLNDLAEAAALSPFHFARSFNVTFGMPPIAM